MRECRNRHLVGAYILVAALCLIIDKNHIWIASVFGAVLHNIGQITVAVLVMGTGVLVYLPFLLVSGCLAGAFTGGCAQLVIGRVKANVWDSI